jgi:hypothetical protein
MRKQMQQVGSESETHTMKMKRTLPPSIGSQDIPLTPLQKVPKRAFFGVCRVWFGL